MQDETSDSIFDIRLNPEGIDAIKRFSKIAKWVFVLLIIIAIITAVSAFASFFLAKERYTSGNKVLPYQLQAYPYYAIIYCMLGIIQGWYYFKTGKNLSESIENNDQAAFNNSFIYLLRHSVFAMLTLSVGLLMLILRFYTIFASLAR